MSFILVLATVVICIGLEIMRRTKRRATLSEKPNTQSTIGSSTIERYYHPGHSWIMVGPNDEITVGVDDFAQRVVGQLSSIYLPVLGAGVQQGQIYATLHRGTKKLPQVAPLSGVIVGVNEKLARTPDLVNASPYERGWIVKLAPANITIEIRNLLRGLVAEQWEEAVRNRLIQWFSRPGCAVLQDGGALVENVSDLMNDQDWQRFVAEFFPITMTNRNNNQIMK